MFYERSKLPGGIATAPPSSWEDVYEASKASARFVDNTNARERSLIAAYDQRIDAVRAATGIALANPLRAEAERIDLTELGFDRDDDAGDRFAVFDNELARLAEQHPEHAGVIRADRSPREDAYARARDVDEASADAFQRYDGPAGTGLLATLAGGLRGGLEDPANIATLPFGFTGRVGLGLKQMLWMGLKQGAANAAVETAFQPTIAGWRQEAGLDYTPSHFAMNVGGAFLLGAGADVGVRGLARGINRARGRVAELDDAGGVVRWETESQALDRAARISADERLRAAEAGDTGALRDLVREAGLDGHPEVRAIDEMLADLEATDIRRPGADAGEVDLFEEQMLRHVADGREPVPLPPEPLPPAGRALAPEDEAARTSLASGALDAVQAARVMRERPQALDQSVSLASRDMQDARALARLSDAAFDLVERGEADPALGALVARHVDEAAGHEEVLRELTALEPRSEAEARRMLVTLDGARDAEPPPGPQGLDDVLGPDGARQVEQLEAQFAHRMDQPERVPDVEREALALAPEASLRQGQVEVDALERMLEVMENCKL